MSAPVLDIRSFSYAAERVPILRDIDLAVREGEFVAVIGPNGAGKSTLLRCIVRVNRGGTGAIRLLGRPLGSYRQRELARVLGYVPQGGAPALPFTVGEYVLSARYAHLSRFGSFRREDRAAVRAALEDTGLAEFAVRRLDTLSGGERQIAAIAAALAQGGRLLLLDEPAAFLDPRHAAVVSTLIRRLNRGRGIAVITVTHDINEAANSADRIAVMHRGRIVHDGPPGGVMTNDVLEPVYGMTFTFTAHPSTGEPVIVPGARP